MSKEKIVEGRVQCPVCGTEKTYLEKATTSRGVRRIHSQKLQELRVGHEDHIDQLDEITRSFDVGVAVNLRGGDA